MPKFMMDCCAPVSTETTAMRLISGPSGLRWRMPGRRSPIFRREYPTIPAALAAWAITVARAAPSTPQPRPATNHKSSAIFITAAHSKNHSAAAEFPTLRRAVAKKLYRNVKPMPQNMICR